MPEGLATVAAIPEWRQRDGAPIVLGNYRLVGVLGEGGMGTVYLGFHEKLQRSVAIKTLRFDRGRQPEHADRFLREMRLVGQMDHPNVVRAFDAGEKNDVHFLVMELLRGFDLATLTKTRGPLPTAEACELVRQAAVGLSYVHRTLVHRDIKPSNLFLTDDGTVKILDLGLARASISQPTDEGTPDGMVLGTYDYLAPEQAVGGKELDGRADIYSLGCTLFKLLVGRAPFAGSGYATPGRKLLAHIQVPVVDVPEACTLPPPLKAILARMTAKNPEDRYADAEEAATALAALAQGARLDVLIGPCDEAEPESRPLPIRLPDDVMRLTAVPHETPLQTTKGSLEQLSHFVRRHAFAFFVCVTCLLVAVVAAISSLAQNRPDAVPPGNGKAALFARGDDETKSAQPESKRTADGQRDLDALTPFVPRSLLDEPVVPIGVDKSDTRSWIWDKKLSRVHALGHANLLFPVGTVSKSRFTFEIGIRGAPTFDRIGLYWGYRDVDPEAKAKRAPGIVFGSFQYLCAFLEPTPKQAAAHFIYRGTCTLKYANDSSVIVDLGQQERHPISRPTGEKTLGIEVQDGVLRRAMFAGANLTSLTSAAASAEFEGVPNEGGLGLVAFRGGGVFDNVRFTLESSK